jgi:hypothetical protein
MMFEDPVFWGGGFIGIKIVIKTNVQTSLVGGREGGPGDGDKIRTNKNNMHQCIYFIRTFLTMKKQKQSIFDCRYIKSK